MQLREIEREVVAIRTQAALLGIAGEPPTLDQARAGLDEWLASPPARAVAGASTEMAQLSEVLGVARR